MWFPDLIPNPEEESEFLKSCCLVLDTNAWLDLYRIGPEDADKVIGVLEKLFNIKRLFTPNQILEEFARNQAAVARGAKTRFEDAKSEMNKAFSKFQSESVFRKPFFHQTNEFKDALKLATSRLDSENEKLREQFKVGDPVLNRATKLLEVSAGTEWDEEELEKAIREGRKRYELKRAPGTADSSKKVGNRDLGDWFLWRQAINYAKENKTDVLLITSDMKFDWYEENVEAGKTELIAEFTRKTGKRLWIMPMLRFLTDHLRDLGIDVPALNPSSLSELMEIQKTSNSLINEDLVYSIPKIDFAKINQEVRSFVLRWDFLTGDLCSIGHVGFKPKITLQELKQSHDESFESIRFVSMVRTEFEPLRVYFKSGYIIKMIMIPGEIQWYGMGVPGIEPTDLAIIALLSIREHSD